MLVYRISTRQYAHDLSGAGAGLYGGRWNPAGISMVYTAGSISLACLEYLVHNFHVMASRQVCLARIRVRSQAIETLGILDLPGDWNEKSYLPASTQKIGVGFVKRAKSYLLKVPSAIVPDEHNFLINPLHPHHRQTVIEELIDPFVFDERLFHNLKKGTAN